MKKYCFFIMIVLGFFSCQKEKTEINHPPVANAGNDITITLPTNTINLDGGRSTDPDNNITSYQWTKISGPSSFNITNVNAAQTQVSNLIDGVYQFELKVTDAGGLFSKDTVQVTVNASILTNHLPVANAGNDTTITMPANTINLNGSRSTDPDNNITGYVWTKISGASSFNITNANAVQTQVSNLLEGVYQFELKVTDAGGLISKDTMQVTVSGINNSLVDVYVAGHELHGNGVAKYWKNGQAIAVTDSTKDDATASSIAVVGNDVYVAGTGFNGSVYVAKYWKNGQAITLTDLQWPKSGSASSIAVVGSDVYVAGGEFSNSSGIAKYWKNGQAIALTDGTTQVSASSIAVVGSDVYVAGGEYQGPFGAAKYWKNGQAIALTDGKYGATASSIVVIGSDVYVAGGEFNVAKYWKNGNPVTLGVGYANSIAVSGNDVYVCGISVDGATYWKNGQAIPLTDGTRSAEATSIAVVSNNVYVVGYEFNESVRVAKYWKNGQAISLTDGTKHANATSIVVIKR